MSRTAIIFFTILSVIHISKGLYISSDTEVQNHNKNEWSTLKNKHGLTNENVKLFKSQKIKQGIAELFHHFLDENSKYYMNAVPKKRVKSDIFMRVHSNIVQQLKTFDGTLKTSFNIQLTENSQKSLSRHRRKIAVKMVSEIPSERIDDILKKFNEKYGIDNINDDTDEVYENERDYIDFPMKLPSATDPDYMYENLYEDEKDLAIPAKSQHSSEYGSIQDLILQASRNQWQREIDETKLHTPSNKHFI